MKRFLSAMWLIACGGSVSTPDVLSPVDAGPSTVADVNAPASDAGSVDAATTCGAAFEATGESCKVGNACGHCALGREYFCKNGAPSTYGRTPMRCVRLEEVGGGPHYCCEAACVRTTAVDGACGDVPRKRAYECPNDGANGSLVGAPSGACTIVIPDISTTHPRIYCCD